MAGGGQKVGRRWAGAEKWDLVSARGPQHLLHATWPPSLLRWPGEPPAVKESGPWVGEEAGEPRPWGKEAGD